MSEGEGPTRRAWWCEPRVDVQTLLQRLHQANLAAAALTPGEQPYAMGWELCADRARIGVALDVDDDPIVAQRWADNLPPGSWGNAQQTHPWPARRRTRWWPLDPVSMAGQRQRDAGLLDRFHVNPQAVDNFEAWVLARVGTGKLYGVDSAGVRTWWPTFAGEPALEQTVTDVREGYGGPTRYTLIAVHEQGWDRIYVGELGRTDHDQWRA